MLFQKRKETIENKPVVYKPQKGPQELFLSLDCDIIVYGGAAGSGKAQPLSAKIVTPFGMSTMGDMEVGKQICNPDGTVAKVLQLHPQGEQDVYKVSFSDGSSTRCTGDHLWLAHFASYKVKADRKYLTFDEDIPIRGRLCTTLELMKFINTERERKYHVLIPLTKPVQYTRTSKAGTASLYPIDPYVLGALLGDGCLTSTVISLTSADQEIIDNVEKGLGFKLSRWESSLYGYGIPDKYGELKRKLANLGLLYHDSYNKFIPENYKYAPIAMRLALLQGLMDTDGTVSSDDVSSVMYGTSSRTLAIDVKQMVESLGGRCTITSKYPTYMSKDELKVGQLAFTCYIVLPNPKDAFRLTRKKERCNTLFNGGYSELTRRMISVELVGREQVQCITVDHPNGLYLTDYFIVTHNSFALLLDPTRNVGVRGYEALLLRRQATQVTSGGGLWDISCKMYPDLGAEQKLTPRPTWIFPSGAKVAFSHLQHEKSVKAWDGAQLSMIGFDELQHFTSTQFWYMLSRNRSTCGVRSYVRATCNPDPDSFLVDLLAWWLDGEGYPIKERSGVVRWLLRINGEVQWYDSYEDARNVYPDKIVPWELRLQGEAWEYDPKSFTFISAKLQDNKTLMKLDPSYLGNLSAMYEYERKRLLLGNWFARPQAGELFKTTYWKYIEEADLPHKSKFKKFVRYWDKAGTLPSDVTPDPDYTVGALLALDEQDKIYVLDVRRGRYEPADVENLVKATSEMDGKDVATWFERDPGSAGKAEAQIYLKLLMGKDVHINQKRTSKLAYWRPFAAQVKEGNVFLVRGTWNRAFVDEMAGVTDGTQASHDDQADASSGAFMVLARAMKRTEMASALSNVRMGQ